MINLNLFIIPIISYLIGSFPTALIVNKLLNKTDPRDTGSKNLGALNTLRITTKNKGKVTGIIAFLFVFLVDAFKGAFCIWLAMAFIPDHMLIAATLATFFSILGHNYSILIKFDGGRGAATLMGIILFLNWKLFILWLLTVVLFSIIFEIFIPVHKKGENFLKKAISNQIIGRLAGEVAVLIPIYFISAFVFWPTLFATPLILIRHIDRVKKQLSK